jgi:hypothetical protein
VRAVCHEFIICVSKADERRRRSSFVCVLLFHLGGLSHSDHLQNLNAYAMKSIFKFDIASVL